MQSLMRDVDIKCMLWGDVLLGDRGGPLRIRGAFQNMRAPDFSHIMLDDTECIAVCRPPNTCDMPGGRGMQTKRTYRAPNVDTLVKSFARTTSIVSR